MELTIIAAVDRNGGIGKNNQLLCHLPADLKHFKSLTETHTVIMGRKTFDSLPKGALPNRRNIVVSRQKGLVLANCEVFESLSDAFASCSTQEKVFIIGGSSIYFQSIANANCLEITKIDSSFDADVFFPTIDNEIWEAVKCENHLPDEKNHYPYSFVTYRKRKTY
ncbi:MAG: dihydrofolate reductase [Paludibacteraceae bacterium]|nr:dihydrofolate reductase [Paludibacteraceae bacterium]